ncbi:MAG: hypothetical protein ACQEQO_11540 [Thermodesulfobacteriota bacterium]
MGHYSNESEREVEVLYLLQMVIDLKSTLNPDYAVATYCDLKNLAATLASRFCFSTYLQICLRRKIAPTSRFAEVFQPS